MSDQPPRAASEPHRPAGGEASPRPAGRRAQPTPSARFDRVGAPGQRRRDGLGKEALYSVAPTSAPTSQVELKCRRCDVPFGLSVLGMVKLLKPPFLWDPVRGRLWTRCPACERRSWLEVRTGQALRVLLDRSN